MRTTIFVTVTVEDKARMLIVAITQTFLFSRNGLMMGSGVWYMGSKDEDVVKYFEKKLCLPMPNLI